MEGNSNLREKVILGVLILLLVAGGAWRAVNVYRAPEPEITQVMQSDLNGQEKNDPEPEFISVHLVGAVNNPGVYQLPEGSRVYELLELGGGFSAEADQEALNQARPLLDGEQIYVHQVGEEPPVARNGGASLININRAGASELTALPGIGEVRAVQIVEHREKHGYFKAKEDIMDVSGIGQATFENIDDLITIY